MRRTTLAAALLLLPFAARADARADAKAFLELYNSQFLALGTVASENEWLATTDVTPIHDAARVASNKAYAAWKGDREIIRQTKALLAKKAELEPLQVRQLEKILLNSATSPGTIPQVVNALVEAESKQSSTMNGWTFCLDRTKAGKCKKPVTANEIDRTLVKSRKEAERLAAWNASKEIGEALRPGLGELQALRNQVAREMGFSSFFALQVADYGMTVPEMMTLLGSFVKDLKPLYGPLHQWTRTQLARRYGQKLPPGPTPAHWLPNRWGQNWNGLVASVDLDPYFKDRKPQWIVEQAERFYVSLGMEPLPKVFWEKSDLYALPATSTRKKNAHASAWHIDGQKDVRSLMSVEPNAEWFGTSHHELGHIYYYLAYARPEVPPVLREGANRAFHEAIGDLVYIAAQQEPYLREQKILPDTATLDPEALLLNEALDQIPFIAWSAGVMSHFERDLYEKNLPASEWQAAWWRYVKEFQDIVPPGDRMGATKACDACTKTHINDDPAGYYDYALASVIKYQLHEYIAKNLLKQDVHRCNYFGNKEVGAFLQKLLALGATRDWRQVLEEATGEKLSTRAMLAYFAPLGPWLARENAKK